MYRDSSMLPVVFGGEVLHDVRKISFTDVFYYHSRSQTLYNSQKNLITHIQRFILYLPESVNFENCMHRDSMICLITPSSEED